MTKIPIFKITGDFSENACFINPNKTSEIMKYKKFAVFTNSLGHKDHIRIKILEFYTQNRAWYIIYDETMQSRSLLEGKTTELKQFMKSIICNPKNCK